MIVTKCQAISRKTLHIGALSVHYASTMTTKKIDSTGNHSAALLFSPGHIMTTAIVSFFFSPERKGRASRKHALHVVPGPSWPSEIIMRAGYVCKSRGEMVFARLSPPRATNLPVVAWPVPSSASLLRSPPLRCVSPFYTVFTVLFLSLPFSLAEDTYIRLYDHSRTKYRHYSRTHTATRIANWLLRTTHAR